MSFIASMVSAAAISAGASAVVGGIAGAAATGAVGAGLGAGVSAATGGDVGEGALMGGISGLASGALAAAAPALQGAEVATEVGKEVGKEAVVQGTEQAAVQGTGQVANQGISALPAVDPTAVVNPASQAVVNPAASQATTAALPPPIDQGGGVITQGLGAQTPPPMANPLPGSQPLNVLAEVPQNSDVLLNGSTGPGWGQQLLNKAGVESQVGSKIGGKAIESSVYNAGINALVAGAQGEDVGKAMAMGAATGAVGGGAGAGLASMAGPSNSGLEYIGNIAAKHDVLVPAALSMGSGMALDSAMTPDFSPPEEKGIRSNYKWNPNVYKPYGPQFAAGGITDLDNYDQAPQMQNPGTLDIPNRNEVTNNQGYMGDSVQMMAGGGILGSLPGANLMQSVYNTTLGDVISPDLRDFLFGTPDDQLSPEQRRKKAQLMQQEGASKGMAHGGISDLGGYSDGGRLLKGPGDGVSDDIPASIGGKQPARLAEGEFVVPARIVSELGNGSTDAGAKRLYQMMDRIQSDRKKTTGKGKFSDNPKASRHLPA